MHQVSMNLLSTERKQLNPEDEIGNIKSSKNGNTESAQITTTTTAIKAQRRRAAFPDDFLPVNVKTVRLIAPMPKASVVPDDADSGISSLASSFVY